MSRASKTLDIVRSQIRLASFQPIPTNAGRTPPTIYQFDPLNPGEWQLGAAGKTLPRLPEGTKVGKLAMGKYGLYDPFLRKRVNTYAQALLDEKKSKECGAFDKGVTTIVKVLGKSITSLNIILGTACFILGYRLRLAYSLA